MSPPLFIQRPGIDLEPVGAKKQGLLVGGGHARGRHQAVVELEQLCVTKGPPLVMNAPPPYSAAAIHNKQRVPLGQKEIELSGS